MSAIITMISSGKNHSYDFSLSFEIMSGIKTTIDMGKSQNYDVDWETEMSQIITMIYRCLTVIRIIALVPEPNCLKL